MTFWNLWLDDQADDPSTPARHCPAYGCYIAAKSSEEAIGLTIKWGLPDFISFDHDLGAEDTAIVYIRWLTENFYLSDVPGYVVHSANPVGHLNIISMMDSWKKSQKL